MSLGLLVGRFGTFLVEYTPAVSQDPHVEKEFPKALTRIREEFNHHIIPLLLLAQADGETVESERLVVLKYCVDRAKNADITLTLEDQEALLVYLRSFRPAQAQLGAALKRLHRESKDDIIRLIDAARLVVDADRVRRLREVQFLDELQQALADL